MIVIQWQASASHLSRREAVRLLGGMRVEQDQGRLLVGQRSSPDTPSCGG